MFPTDSKIVNLNKIQILKNKLKIRTGYQDHSCPLSLDAYLLPILSLFYGAEVIEKHVTLSRKHKGADYQSSFEFSELKKLCENLKKTKHDNYNVKGYLKGFNKYRKYNNKIFFFSKNLNKGDKLDNNSIQLKTNSDIKKGFTGEKLKELVGKFLLSPVKKDTPVLKKILSKR